MSLPTVTLNDGKKVPILGFGTGTAHFGKDAEKVVEVAYGVGYHHIDTAELYRNEDSVGNALKNVVKKREDLFLTTKLGTADPAGSFEKSIKMLDLEYVDLYLIHSPILVKDIGLAEAWKRVEKIQKDGQAKSIGVSNYRVKDIEETLKTATVTPAANQIEFHPYVYTAVKPLLDLCHKHNITIECYGPLSPITKKPGGPVDEYVNKIAKELGSTPGQVLLKWAQQVSKGIVVTTSGKQERMTEQLKAFTDFRDLTDEELSSITKAGSIIHERYFMKHMDTDE